jgi:hypothetical protein
MGASVQDVLRSAAGTAGGQRQVMPSRKFHMTDFNISGDSIDVEQIMRQIRARIREKRGVDYTEKEIRELAEVRLERFFDPKNVRSDLLDQFRRNRARQQRPQPPNYAFEDTTLFESHRTVVSWIRKLLRPVLKLFFNPNPLIQALNIQSRLNIRNAENESRQEAMEALYYEVLHNLVVELTRLGIEVKNLKMRVESLSSRLDFDERRARALENVVEYKQRPAEPEQGSTSEPATEGGETEGSASLRTRRRRRRRARRVADRPVVDVAGAQEGDGEEALNAVSSEEEETGAEGATPPQGGEDRLTDEPPLPMGPDNEREAGASQTQPPDPAGETAENSRNQ